MDTPNLSPREFLKARRPERFSDSVIEKTSALDRSMLEYHLESLTNRSQETDFQQFAQHLAEREICPNLLPQTGPTGGGDSKVDTETYPVADALSITWYTGIGREAASERWAFAISAKKDWRSKVKADIAKIEKTERGYKKIFFITNQYVKDKDRASVEDSLSKEHGCDTRILDRTWILDRVFKNGHQDLAINDLSLTSAVRLQVRKGPLDFQREQDLKELEQRIKKAAEEQNLGVQSVQDCIDAATLSRSLDHPRTEVDGRFLRAERMAKDHGTPHQRLISVYQKAWTCYWWYEDHRLFAEIYPKAEAQAIGSQNVYDLELLTNLWMVLSSLTRNGTLPRGDLDTKTKTLTSELERLGKEENRPSTSLHARTLFLQVRLAFSLPGNVDAILKSLGSVIRECHGLVGYPVEPLVEILTELGDFLGDRPAYAKLFKELIEFTSSRKGEVTAARLLLRRGVQELEANRPYEAIKFLGQSLGRLQKHESRHDAVHALYVCASAYERAGLFWAARGTMLTAASIATNEFWSYSDVTPMQASCYRRLKWLELQLGRIPHILAWHETHHGVRQVLNSKGFDSKRLHYSEKEFDIILGILLLKADIWQLNEMSYLPNVLDSLELHASAIALLYALGHEDELPKTAMTEVPAGEPPRQVFQRWRDQPAAEDLPQHPFLDGGQKATFNSSILGCRITLEAENCSPCIELAESILAALESLLSTGLNEGLITREPTLTIQIRKSDFTEKPFTFELRDKDGRPHIAVCSTVFEPHKMTVEAQREIREKLFELLVTILARVFLLPDPKKLTTKLFREERALERAINFTSSFVTIGNVLGHTPKTRMSDWRESAQWRQYPLLRREVWDSADSSSKEKSSKKLDSKPSIGKGEPPADLLLRGDTRQSQIETFSLIRETLWNQAKWSGTGFITHPKNSVPPVLALLFDHSESANQIFDLWRRELGSEDAEERLRISIIRGIDKKHPYHYRVVIGINPSVYLSKPDVKYAFFVAKLNTMEPNSHKNLDLFLHSYRLYGQYLLAHGFLQNGAIRLDMDSAMAKRELHLRDAWEIGRNDPDSVAISKSEEPIIPPEHLRDAPVLELIKFKRKKKKRASP
jgi:hypothetical protein